MLNEKECQRRYGSASKSTKLMGFVAEVKTEKPAGRQKANTLIHIVFPVDDNYTKAKWINLRSVQRVEEGRQLPAEQQGETDKNKLTEFLLVKIKKNMVEDGTRLETAANANSSGNQLRNTTTTSSSSNNPTTTTTTTTSNPTDNPTSTSTSQNINSNRLNTSTSTSTSSNNINNSTNQENQTTSSAAGNNNPPQHNPQPSTNINNNRSTTEPSPTSTATENDNTVQGSQQNNNDDEFHDAREGERESDDESSLVEFPQLPQLPPPNTSASNSTTEALNQLYEEQRSPPPSNIRTESRRATNSEDSSVTTDRQSSSNNNNNNNNNNNQLRRSRRNIFANTQRGNRNNAVDLLINNNQRWVENNIRSYTNANGDVNERNFILRGNDGIEITPNSQRSRGMSRLDWFLLSFPPAELAEIIRLTNLELSKQNVRDYTTDYCSRGEMVKFLGVLILMTRFEFNDRASLWKTTSISKYIPAPAFGRTGISRNRFDMLWRCIRFSEQAPVRPEGMSHAEHRWQLVDGFVERFNAHRERIYSPTHLICVDESMIRWYGLGGSYINIGLPQYVEMERKPEKGGEIQNAADGVTGIMMRLHVVKGAENERLEALRRRNNVDDDDEPGEEEVLHGAHVMAHLVKPWWRSGRVVCADSYFASVPAAKVLHDNGLKFIGVIKTATRQFPMQWLSSQVLQSRGDFKALVNTHQEDTDPDLHAFVWMDRDRRYFISSAYNMNLGDPCVRRRWRQIDDVSTNADPSRMELSIDQPIICEKYYSACGKIDSHNRCRQDDMNLEKKIETNDWSKRFNMSIFGMTVVDAWLMFKACVPDSNESQKEFYKLLAEEMIDNKLDEVVTRNRATRRPPADQILANASLTSGTGVHLTPTKEKRKNRDGELTGDQLKQGRCRICTEKKSCYICSECKREHGINVWLCHSRTGRTCFHQHYCAEHN